MPQKRTKRRVPKDSFLVIDLDDEEVKGTGTTITTAFKDAEERADANCETLTDGRLVLTQILWHVRVTATPRLARGEAYK